MTKQLRNKTVCPHCGHEFDTTTPFSQWVREERAQEVIEWLNSQLLGAEA